jgi:hypothetical protein
MGAANISFVAVFGCRGRARECAVRTNSFSDESQSSCKSNKKRTKPQDLLHPSENMRMFSTTFDSHLEKQLRRRRNHMLKERKKHYCNPNTVAPVQLSWSIFFFISMSLKLIPLLHRSLSMHARFG